MQVNDSKSESSREPHVRREARNQGLLLRKSRDRSGPQEGTYHLVDGATNAVVCSSGHSGHGLNLDEVETWLKKPEGPRTS